MIFRDHSTCPIPDLFLMLGKKKKRKQQLVVALSKTMALPKCAHVYNKTTTTTTTKTTTSLDPANFGPVPRAVGMAISGALSTHVGFLGPVNSFSFFYFFIFGDKVNVVSNCIESMCHKPRNKKLKTKKTKKKQKPR